MNPYAFRRYIIAAIFIATALLYILRLFYLQIIDRSYERSAENNSRRFVTQYPARGLMFDRNGKLMVYNEAAYDLMITPVEVKAFDTVEFASLIDMSIATVREKIKKSKVKTKTNNIFKPSLFASQLSAQTYALLEEKLYKYPGFFVQIRTLRRYAKPIAAHLLGYVSEVDSNEIRDDSYYKTGDYIGKSGLEKSYETELRGKKGVTIQLVDVHNRVKGLFQNGRYDTAAVVGNDLTLSIDLDLQTYGEYLMQNMSGGAVAIEPSTGEILALISEPTYDPQLLIGRERSINYPKLSRDSINPLFFRAAMANYPPGSTFKIINGIIGLQEGVLSPSTRYSCPGGYNYGGPKLLACTHVHGSLDLAGAVAQSCNTYFCNVFRTIIDNRKYSTVKESYNIWRDDVMSFGIGHRLGTDIPNELNGNVPSAGYYDKVFGKDRWKSATIISLAIGQAEMGITPLQLANMTTVIANRGYYYIPHLVRNIKNEKGIDPKFLEKHYTPFDTSTFNRIIAGMRGAVVNGTSTEAQLPGIEVCGKTGTAQNPHGNNHSVFVTFAPRINPKIVIAVYVENAGYGATWALPVASLMMEKYMTGKVTRPALEQRVLSFRRKYVPKR
ncbi:MAG TPA: penicillin-binding protein 2 [Bacteroidales bacterium]